MIRRHRWSAVSLAITIGAAAVIFAYTQYQYRLHGIKDFSWLSPYGGCAVIASVVTGIVAVRVEKASVVSVIAMTLGIFSVAFYTV